MLKKPEKGLSQPKIPNKIAFPSTSKMSQRKLNDPDQDVPKEPWGKRCCRFMYNRHDKTFCERTCSSWFYIIGYSILYLIFLSTYTMMFLYLSLTIIKYIDDFQVSEKVDLLTYGKNGIGLSTTPTSVNNLPLIWYRNEPNDYKRYVDLLEQTISQRHKRDLSNHKDLGPCGSRPFGYGNTPCVFVRINKQLKWTAKPLNLSSIDIVNVPSEVRDWMKNGKPKLWLHCEGYNSYDKEHIGIIKYYPHPPGFDPEMFPLDMKQDSPLVAVQISNFTLGLSLAIQCKLWYEGGVSTTEFVLFVTRKKKVVSEL